MSKKGDTTGFQWGSWQIGGPRHYFRESLILRVIKQELPAGRILDIGCGTGSLMEQLARRGYEVSGVDASDECIQRTTERLSHVTQNMPPVVKKGRAEQIDFPDQSFDAVIAAEVLEHVEGDDLAVKEFHRLLKPGGLCLITVPANPALWDISDEIAGHKRRYKKDDLLRLFNNASFQVERFLYLGFPLLRLYHRLVFIRWARHMDQEKGGRVSSEGVFTRIGLSRGTALILGNLFRIDNLFSRLPWGIGILLVARKY